MTYQAIFETGWKATLVAATKAEAERRFSATGRGERFKVQPVGADQFRIYGSDADDDYSDDGEV